MKSILVFLIAFCLTLSVSQAQSSADKKVIGTYVGQYKWEDGHAVIKIKKNHSYVIKKYDWSGKCQTTTTGTWSVDGHKLLLKEKSGAIVILEKDQETTNGLQQPAGWYIYGASAYSYGGYFLHGVSEKSFKKMLATRGC